VDHLARGSMKNAANCASECELQDIWASTLWTHIADTGSSTVHVWLRVGFVSLSRTCVLEHWALFGPTAGVAPRFERSCIRQVPTLGILPGSATPSAGRARRRDSLFARDRLPLNFRPESRQGDPPNLSILISGGKENNRDALSNCEWNGRSPAPNRRPPRSRGMWCSGEPPRVVPAFP